MAPLQSELYKLMKFEVARQARSINIRSKQALRTLGRSVSRLLQFVSNPALVGSDLNFISPNMLSAVLEEGEGPKLRYVLRQTRRLAGEGKKVLLWSSFVRNVEYLADRLSDLGAVYIHGGVDVQRSALPAIARSHSQVRVEEEPGDADRNRRVP
jgi:hypothetical protein